MNIFEPQTSLKNITYPVIKIAVAALLILACFFRKQLFHIESAWLNALLSIISVLLVILCILCIYISVYEIFNMFESKGDQYNNTDTITEMSIDEVIRLVDTNDIIEISIKHDSSILLIGSSADCKNGSNVFFDKRFYCGDIEFKALKEFSAYLTQYATNDILCVVSVDGVAP